MRPTARIWLCFLAAFVALTACHRDERPDVTADPADHGSVVELGDADTILATDLVGSVLEETSATGAKQAEFAAYPFGVARFDTSLETRKFASVPRDGAVSLDHMGARFYAPDLGIWTSGEPLAITDPERLVCDQFAAANPYAYSNLSPTIAGDRDGHFWHVLAGGAIGAAIGAGSEAVRQYLRFGKIEDVGRIEAAAAGGFLSGTLAALNPAASLAAVIGTGAGVGAVSGVTERLVASGGKSIGTAREIATDAAIGGVTDGLAHGAATLIKRAVTRVGEAGKTALERVGGRGATILGENMRDRVIPFADKTGARTLPFARTKKAWDELTPREQWKLNDASLRARINEGDQFRYIGADPLRPEDARKAFDLTGSELLRLEERGVPYETVTETERASVFKEKR